MSHFALPNHEAVKEKFVPCAGKGSCSVIGANYHRVGEKYHLQPVRKSLAYIVLLISTKVDHLS